MIIEYHRPKTTDEALTLLRRARPRTLPLGGGMILSKHDGDDIAVVDLQNLGLDTITETKDEVVFGCSVTLQQLFEKYATNDSILEAIKIDVSTNARQTMTLGGFLSTADGRSALLTVLLAMDLKLVWLPGETEISLGDWLPKRGNWHEGLMISKIKADPKVATRFESIGRSRFDKPVICCAISRWPSGRVRAAVGGFGASPLLALDGNQTDNIGLAVKDCCKGADDQWATSEYRQNAAEKLGIRLANELFKFSGGDR